MATLYTRDGYTAGVIAQNYRMLIAMGETKADAINTAHRLARECFRRQHRTAKLPPWIYPQPITLNKRGRRVKANPAPRIDAFDAAGAAKLYRRFNGKEPNTSAKMRKPVIPDAMACIGQVTVIQYVAERDGEVNEYRHPFRSKSRPHLCVSPDGKLVLMLGGAFTFTEDGFADE